MLKRWSQILAVPMFKQPLRHVSEPSQPFFDMSLDISMHPTNTALMLDPEILSRPNGRPAAIIARPRCAIPPSSVAWPKAAASRWCQQGS